MKTDAVARPLGDGGGEEMKLIIKVLVLTFNKLGAGHYFIFSIEGQLQ